MPLMLGCRVIWGPVLEERPEAHNQTAGCMGLQGQQRGRPEVDYNGRPGGSADGCQGQTLADCSSHGDLR